MGGTVYEMLFFFSLSQLPSPSFLVFRLVQILLSRLYAALQSSLVLFSSNLFHAVLIWSICEVDEEDPLQLSLMFFQVCTQCVIVNNWLVELSPHLSHASFALSALSACCFNLCCIIVLKVCPCWFSQFYKFRRPPFLLHIWPIVDFPSSTDSSSCRNSAATVSPSVLLLGIAT